MEICQLEQPKTQQLQISLEGAARGNISRKVNVTPKALTGSLALSKRDISVMSLTSARKSRLIVGYSIHQQSVGFKRFAVQVRNAAVPIGVSLPSSNAALVCFDQQLTFSDPDIGMTQKTRHLTDKLPCLGFGQKAPFGQLGDRSQCLDDDRFLRVY